MMLKYVIALAVLLIVAAFAAWAFLPARHLPGNRARHLRLRLHLRLHPGKGFAPAFTLWLRWGRLAALRRSGKIRPSLPLHERLLDPRAHSVLLGRAHYRHRLQIPLEEHVLVMAPPRTYKSAFLADVILRYPGPVIATTTKPDIFALTSAVRSYRGPVHVFNPQGIGGVPSTFCWSPVEGCEDPATGPGTCASGCTCGCTPARASPTSSACGCAGAASLPCAAPQASARPSRCGTASWTRASTRSSSAAPTTGTACACRSRSTA